MKAKIILMIMISASIILSAVEKRANIIFILADDLGYNDLSCYGQKNFKTPILDKMAAEGIMFTQHYAGSTVCGPSRSSLLTGLHTGHSYLRGNGKFALPADPASPTIASHLQKAGYVTAMIGKSGVACASKDASLPNKKGFDHFYGYLAHKAAHHHYPRVLWKNGKEVIFPGNFEKYGDTYADDVAIDDSLRFIEENKNKPFFLHLALTAPHADLTAPAESIKPFLGKMGQERPFPDSRKGYAGVKEPKAAFAGMVTHIDRRIGDLFNKLKELKLDKNTLVIFSSDNGPHQEGGHRHEALDSNGILRGGKRDLYEGGIRVPFIAWWPGKIKAGTVSNHLSAFWDFMPTALEVAKANLEVETDGISYLPTMLGKSSQKKHKYLYWEFYERSGKQALRWGKWKAVRVHMHKFKEPKFKLYNLDIDLAERKDISDQYPEIIAEIHKMVKEAHTDSDIFKFRGKK
ncbi:MAG: arylsulfatase [Lentisphaeraceae bacterium]|nr:arylsulfatase [Lentisphaeraceae bacterium]